MDPSRSDAWKASGLAAGTFIQTARGMRPIERVEPGVDEIEFRDGTRAPLLHMYRHEVAPEALARVPELCPLRIPPLALGGALPVRTVLAAPSLFVLASGRLVKRVTSHPEVLLPLSVLVGHNGIAPALLEGGVTVFQPVTEMHGLFRADGLICETLFLGDGAPEPLVAEMGSPTKAAYPMAPALPRVDEDTAQKLVAKLMVKNRVVGDAEAE